MASVKISTTTIKERETLRDISPYFSSIIQPKCGETNIEEKKNTKNQKKIYNNWNAMCVYAFLTFGSIRNINPRFVYQRATHIRRCTHNKKPGLPKQLNVITLILA